MDALPDYAELHALSNFSFLRGASHPAELIGRASALGYRALALTDECSMAGVVRAHVRAKELELPLIVGAEFTLACGLKFVALAATRRGYGQICQLITARPARGAQGFLPAHARGSAGLRCRHGAAGCAGLPADLAAGSGSARLRRSRKGSGLREHYADALWLGVSLLRSGRDAVQLRDITGTGRAAWHCLRGLRRCAHA